MDVFELTDKVTDILYKDYDVDKIDIEYADYGKQSFTLLTVDNCLGFSIQITKDNQIELEVWKESKDNQNDKGYGRVTFPKEELVAQMMRFISQYDRHYHYRSNARCIRMKQQVKAIKTKEKDEANKYADIAVNYILKAIDDIVEKGSSSTEAWFTYSRLYFEVMKLSYPKVLDSMRKDITKFIIEKLENKGFKAEEFVTTWHMDKLDNIDIKVLWKE